MTEDIAKTTVGFENQKSKLISVEKARENFPSKVYMEKCRK